jgi:hypothetical protein
MLDKSLNLCESKNSDARKVAYFLNERFVPALETLIEAKEDKEEVELSPAEAKKVLEKVQKGLETILAKVTDEDLQKDIQDYIDQVEDILNPEEDEEEGEDEGSEEGEEKEPKEIEEAKKNALKVGDLVQGIMGVDGGKEGKIEKIGGPYSTNGAATVWVIGEDGKKWDTYDFNLKKIEKKV